MRLKDKTAFITGSSSGMGAQTAILFAKNGCKVAINYRSNKEEGEAVLNEVKSVGGDGILVQGDISDPSDVNRMFEEIFSQFGKLDILINNAGIDKPKPFLEATIQDWDQTMRVNLYGAFLCSQAAAKHMLENKKGKILNTTSVRALYHAGRDGNIIYSASKAALYSFTKTLAKELAPYIQVNGIAPGPANTSMNEVWTEEVRNEAIELSYLKRLVEPEDIANTYLFLASDESNAMTGEIIVVDGGYNLQ